jgi:hypothetical protein
MHRTLHPTTFFLLAGLLAGAVAPELRAAQQQARPEKVQDKGQDKKKRKFVTFTQAEWGEAAREGGRAGKLRDEQFKKAFPKGLTIGLAKKDGQEHTLSSAEDVALLLPVYGPCGILESGDAKGAQGSGALAGQLVAAKLNVAYNDENLLPDKMTRNDNDLLLAELVFDKNVHKKLEGVSVKRLIRLTDRAISGRIGVPKNENDPLVDVDQDEKADLSLEDLREALHTFNWNFNDEAKNVGNLKPRPDAAGKGGEVVEPRKVGAPRKVTGKINLNPPTDSGAGSVTVKKVGPPKNDVERAQLIADRNAELEKLKNLYLAAMKQAKADADAKGQDKVPLDEQKKLAAAYQAQVDEVNARYEVLRPDKPTQDKPKQPAPKKIGPAGTPQKAGDGG